MDRKTIIALVAVVIIVVGGAFAYVLVSTKNKVSIEENSSTSKTTKTSLSALLEKNQPRKCTYDGTVKSGKYSGTAYFSSDKQMRNDYKSTVNGKARNGGMIITGETQYFWNTETKKGYKMAMMNNKTQDTDSESSQNTENDSVDTDAKFKFHCESWKVDDNKFTPPSDIAIQDLTQMMQNMPMNQ